MQPKNVMLLGFVNKAAEYLDENLENEANNSKLATLKHIDFAKIKKELSDNLDASLGIMQSTMTSLLNAGSDAFNEFLYSDDRETLAQQMAKEFDFNFDEIKDDKKDLDELLTFYNLDKKFDSTEEEIILPEENKEDVEIDFDSKEIEEEKIDLVETLNSYVSSEEEETKACELDEESLELMELIENNVNKVNNGVFEKYEPDAIDDEINEIFSEIELNAQDDEFENILSIIEEEVINEEIVVNEIEEVEVKPFVDFDSLYKERFLQDTIIHSILNAKVIDLVLPKVEVFVQKEEIDFEKLNKERYLQDSIIKSIMNLPNFDKEEVISIENLVETVEVEEEIPVENIVEAVEIEEIEEETPVEVLVEYVPLNELNETASISKDLIEQLRAQMILEDEQAKAVKEQEELEALRKEIELQDATIKSVLSAEKEEIESPDSYLEGLLDDLKNQMIIEDEQSAKVQEEKENAYRQISETYPYLSQGFISNVYDLKEEIADTYKIDEKVIALHRLVFKDVEKLRQFVEIVLEHDYQVNVDESKLIVDTFKQYVNKDGKILSNIFEIANQAKALDGDYEGYRIIEYPEGV